MKKSLEIALGIVTSVGGFLEIGSIVTAAQAGARYRMQLIWAVALGALGLLFLVEMSGRFAAVSKHTIVDALRERFGIKFFALCCLPLLIVMLLVLSAEIGGVCAALEMATGLNLRCWPLPVGLFAWVLLWKGSFGFIEKGVSLLGLITLAFIVGFILSHPQWRTVAAGFIPTMPSHEPARYWFIAVSILGASISPYLMFFYSAGAVEDKWNKGYLGMNRIVASGGMSFGGFISISVLGLAALVFWPHGIHVEHYQQLPSLLRGVFGSLGAILVIASLGISCLGAALEIALESAYLIAQGLGWNWGKNMRPTQDARFSAVYTLALLAGSVIMLTGIDPLKLTVISMALTAATLPLAVTPFLVLMNDENYLGNHCNHWSGNLIVLAITLMACVLAVTTIPLEILGG